MAKQWTMVRLEEGVADWLREEADRLANANQAGHTQTEEWNPDTKNPAARGISLSDMVMLLLRDRSNKRRRRRKAAKARRTRRRTEGQG